MKKIIATLFVLCFTVTLKSQNMSFLYHQVIDDCYKRLHSNLNPDSMYISDFSVCENSKFPYNVSTENKKIKFGFPKVDEKNPFGIVYKLNYPELEKDLVVISLGIYSIRYNNGGKSLIFNGTVLYEFKYNKRKRDYMLVKQVNSGL